MEWWELLKRILLVFDCVLLCVSLGGAYVWFFKRRQHASEPAPQGQLLKSVTFLFAASPLLVGFAFLSSRSKPSFRLDIGRATRIRIQIGSTHMVGLYLLLMSWPGAPLLAVYLAILARIRFQFPVWRIAILAALSSVALIA